MLREVLLGLLADDDTLEPRHSGDVSGHRTYAPLIVAGFGLGEVVPGAHPAHKLRVRLADRSLIQTNPCSGVTAQLLSLAGGRATATEVLNLAHTDPVRARFGFTDDDLEDIADWVRRPTSAGVRPGAPPPLRRRLHPQHLEIRPRPHPGRVALSDDSSNWLENTLPLDDVGSNECRSRRPAGRVLRTAAERGRRSQRQPVAAGWLTALTDGIRLLTRVDDGTPGRPASWSASSTTSWPGPGTGRYRAAAARHQEMLHRQLAGRPTRANFRTGTLTVCTMVPMRSVPHRVVCLVGGRQRLSPHRRGRR